MPSEPFRKNLKSSSPTINNLGASLERLHLDPLVWQEGNCRAFTLLPRVSYLLSPGHAPVGNGRERRISAQRRFHLLPGRRIGAGTGTGNTGCGDRELE